MQSERALKRKVFKELGVRSEKPLAEVSNPAIHALLRPFENEEFPLNRFHDYSRLPIEHWNKWIDFNAIKNEMKANKKIKKLAEKEGEGAFHEAIVEGLRWRAIKGYEEEWADLSGEDIQNCVVKPSGGLPAKANQANAKAAVEDLRERIAKLSKHGKVRLMDLGSGGGGTIIPVLAGLSEEERKRVEVHLVDVMSAGLKHAKKELKELGVGSVKTHKTNFYDLAYQVTGRKTPLRTHNPLKLVLGSILKKRVKGLKGKMDVVVSGAALHHAGDMAPIFEGVNSLTKADGAMYLFDWGHSRTISPTINLDDSKLLEKIAPSAENSPSHLDTVKSMTRTWFNLWGYGEKAQGMLEKRLEQGGKFNFVEWLKENREKLEPYREKSEEEHFLPWCMEGHRNPEFYSKLLEKEGFKTTVRYPFAEPGKHAVGNMLYLISARKKK